LACERLVLGLWPDVLFIVLFDLDVYVLTVLCVHDRERGAALSDAVENVGVLRVVGSVKITVIHRKTISPEV
jgi:hypothetical protein